MNYSTTYVAEIVKLISIFGLLLGFDVDVDSVTAVVGLLFIIGSSAYTLYRRFQAGGVSAFGFRK
jgi:hypothetical protein